ncbi:putative damage-inducible protein DinB [Prauserella isguenensis]|uniref:Putative damage-inducible protein DinB n=1 Tax=Prauserella isguenensis TaxID=1470180 RepID=A0A839S1B9_9PSEU|nr:DinB family protein [Prauserella isguenensis]MBB3051113.1 putative damage-inducible protein DinB [Prauserella isguenensis]
MTTTSTSTSATRESTTPGDDTTAERERADLAWLLERQRWFLRFTARDLDDEQACRRTTVSELTLAGLVKHVAATERAWVAFAGGDGRAVSGDHAADRGDEFRMLPGETLQGLLDDYAETARRTAEFLATADLDARFPLPEAPWFPPGESWSVRQVLQHVAAETAQHAGHADIIREALDGARTMG